MKQRKPKWSKRGANVAVSIPGGFLMRFWYVEQIFMEKQDSGKKKQPSALAVLLQADR